MGRGTMRAVREQQKCTGPPFGLPYKPLGDEGGGDGGEAWGRWPMEGG